MTAAATKSRRRAPSAPTVARDTTIATYRARRDFATTPEPSPGDDRRQKAAPIFVVQKHDATRLHWDFRLEHGGVLWSWAVPKGPSLDPHDKRLAVRVEDHPIDYADFEGTIPEGQYGAGTVEIWDRGTWQPQGDAEEGIRRGELKFVLSGDRLTGGFVLVRLKPRPKDRAENWLLIKEHDTAERDGADAAALEAETRREPARKPATKSRAKSGPATGDTPPVPGAIRGALPETQAPQLATLVETPPAGDDWISEVKFDGYRLLAFKDGAKVRLITRNGHDWTARLPGIATAIGRLKPKSALLDGELVALQSDGRSSFAALQDALSRKDDGDLYFTLFDLLHLDGWDLRFCRLLDRKAALHDLAAWRGTLRYSDHMAGTAGRVRREACAMGLEGIVCKQADAPYHPGRGRGWVKVKCQGREEFIVLGWTPPAGSRVGLGALHLGFHDEQGALHYAGGVGTGFSDKELAALRKRLGALAADAPPDLRYADEPPDRQIRWVTPELVAEVQFIGWSGAGRVRHAVYLGLREDKAADEVVRPLPDPKVARRILGSASPRPVSIVRAAPPRPRSTAARAEKPATPRHPPAAEKTVAGVHITHPDRELWPGITKLALATYWHAVAETALPGIADRPLALVRCPDGIAGEHFFQKHAHGHMPPQIREGAADGAPYLAISDAAGLAACAQMSAIELHSWGATEADALHADRLVFDLDPGEGVTMPDIVAAALDVRRRLEALGMAAFCRTSGGKGLHVVSPVRTTRTWDSVRAWCRAFAERMERDQPDRYVASTRKARRGGKILVDWLRNGLGSTAVASYVPRARPGACVATPLAWREVTPTLDPAAHTLGSIPARLARLRRDPWEGFVQAARELPEENG
jgi:bifunctional non-homologous end joining protein LigD